MSAQGYKSPLLVDYLKGRGVEISHLLIHSPNDGKNQGWASQS